MLGSATGAFTLFCSVLVNAPRERDATPGKFNLGELHDPRNLCKPGPG
jgi:hypothetical protein